MMTKPSFKERYIPARSADVVGVDADKAVFQLRGYRCHEADAVVRTFLEDAYRHGLRKVVFETGPGSFSIGEDHDWCLDCDEDTAATGNSHDFETHRTVTIERDDPNSGLRPMLLEMYGEGWEPSYSARAGGGEERISEEEVQAALTKWLDTYEKPYRADNAFAKTPDFAESVEDDGDAVTFILKPNPNADPEADWTPLERPYYER